eukprot:gene18543-20404_t
MVWWDRELKRRLQNHGIEIQLYERYVDDTNILVKTVTDMDARPNDETIMMEIQTIANEIHPSISVTIDYPTNHTNKRMPVLDLELWIDMVETNGTLKHQILFTHYMKPMTSKYVINKRSALSTTMKKSVLVSDLVRTMRNVSLQCPESERQKHVQNFIKRMQFSGYDQQECVKVYTTAKRKYEQIIEKDRKGECPMYRGKLWQRERREKAKIKKKRTWYEKGGYETVLFVDATPNEELARECQRIVNQSELKIKVIEKAGKSLKESLVLSDPFKNKTCEDNDCKVCKHDPKANCKVRDVVYEISCLGSHMMKNIKKHAKVPGDADESSKTHLAMRFFGHLINSSSLLDATDVAVAGYVVFNAPYVTAALENSLCKLEHFINTFSPSMNISDDMADEEAGDADEDDTVTQTCTVAEGFTKRETEMLQAEETAIKRHWTARFAQEKCKLEITPNNKKIVAVNKYYNPKFMAYCEDYLLPSIALWSKTLCGDFGKFYKDYEKFEIQRDTSTTEPWSRDFFWTLKRSFVDDVTQSAKKEKSKKTMVQKVFMRHVKCMQDGQDSDTSVKEAWEIPVEEWCKSSPSANSKRRNLLGKYQKPPRTALHFDPVSVNSNVVVDAVLSDDSTSPLPKMESRQTEHKNESGAHKKIPYKRRSSNAFKNFKKSNWPDVIRKSNVSFADCTAKLLSLWESLPNAEKSLYENAKGNDCFCGVEKEALWVECDLCDKWYKTWHTTIATIAPRSTFVSVVLGTDIYKWLLSRTYARGLSPSNIAAQVAEQLQSGDGKELTVSNNLIKDLAVLMGADVNREEQMDISDCYREVMVRFGNNTLKEYVPLSVLTVANIQYCGRCRHTSGKIEDENSILAQVLQGERDVKYNLKDLLWNSLACGYEFSEDIKCPSCKTAAADSKILNFKGLLEAPVFLLVTLERVNAGSIIPISTRVEIPLVMDMGKSIAGTYSEVIYEFFALIKWCGRRVTSGHYTAYVRDGEATVRVIDDNRIHTKDLKVLNDRAKQKGVKMLFYVRKDCRTKENLPNDKLAVSIEERINISNIVMNDGIRMMGLLGREDIISTLRGARVNGQTLDACLQTLALQDGKDIICFNSDELKRLRHWIYAKGRVTTPQVGKASNFARKGYRFIKNKLVELEIKTRLPLGYLQMRMGKPAAALIEKCPIWEQLGQLMQKETVPDYDSDSTDEGDEIFVTAIRRPIEVDMDLFNKCAEELAKIESFSKIDDQAIQARRSDGIKALILLPRGLFRALSEKELLSITESIQQMGISNLLFNTARKLGKKWLTDRNMMAKTCRLAMAVLDRVIVPELITEYLAKRYNLRRNELTQEITMGTESQLLYHVHLKEQVAKRMYYSKKKITNEDTLYQVIAGKLTDEEVGAIVVGLNQYLEAEE